MHRSWSIALILAHGCAAEPQLRDSPVAAETPDPWTGAPATELETPPPRPRPLDASIRITPHPRHPLLAVVDVDCEPRCSITVFVDGPGVDGRQERGALHSPVHRHVVAGMRQDSDYDIHVVARDGAGRTATAAATIQTGNVPIRMPEFDLTVAGDPDGLLLTGAAVLGSPSMTSVYFALDSDAEVVWYYHARGVPGDVPLIRRRDDGTFFINQLGVSQIIDIEGNVLHHFEDSTGDQGWHHDRLELPNGNLLVLGTEVQTHQLPDGPQRLVGDVVFEVDVSGRQSHWWSALDTLDPLRFPGPLSTGWWGAGMDWSHGNALAMTPDGEGWVVSLRHQHWIVRVDHASSEVDWVLGRDGDFELTAGTWFDSQHNPVFVGSDELLVYDNGTERYQAGGAGSRVVRYHIDEDARTIRQLWAWPIPVRTPIVGGVQQWDDRVLVTAGGGQDGDARVYLVTEDGHVDWSVRTPTLLFRSELVDRL